MFNIFKRDPIREMKKEVEEMAKIPAELIAVTGETFASACDVLVRVGLKGRFDEDELFAEICAFHLKTVVVTMNRTAGLSGEEAYERGANFVVKAVPEVLANARSKGVPDTAMFQPLISEKTMDRAKEYYLGLEYEVTDADVLDFGRKYNPKLVSLSRDERTNSAFAYIIQAVRISRVEDLSSDGARTAAVAALNNTLLKAVMELETKVAKLAPKG
jgi:hypothetical protein